MARSRIVEAMPFYYGWVVLAVATVGMAATLPAQTAGISLFIDGFIRELDLSRSAVSWMYTAGTVAGASALPLVGRGLDRFGPRRMGVGIVLLLALTCIGMGYVEGWIALLVGFTMLRGVGQGALALVNNHSVNLWFERRRGFAIGVLGFGMSGATALFPPLINDLIAAQGWRTAFIVMGGLVGLVMGPLGALFYRSEPEAYGLQPDENAPEEAPGASPSPDASASPGIEGLTLDRAWRTRTFWIITVGGVCTAGLGTGLLFHHFSIMADNGISREAAALLFVPLGVVTAGATLGAGWLLDYISPRRVMGGLLVLFSAMMVALPSVTTEILVWGYGIVFGVVQGLQGATLGSAYAYYFGRAHHGTVRGMATTIFVGGTAIGPPLLALGPDLMSGYAPVLWMVAPVPLGLGLAAFAAEHFRWDRGQLVNDRP